jgi:glutathione peroxidase
LFQFTCKDIDGSEVNLASVCKDKKCILIVNVASKCAKTKQNYTELVELYSRYASKGLQILAFPSNTKKAKRTSVVTTEFHRMRSPIIMKKQTTSQHRNQKSNRMR